MGGIGTDVTIFETRYARSDIREIFSEEEVADLWLKFEGILAETQGELGIIPQEAAREIRNKASLRHVDFDRIAELYGEMKHPGAATVRALSEVCGHSAGEWVHYGSSAPELWENTLAYQLKLVLDIYESELESIIGSLNDLAQKHRNSVMLERSLGRHALPTTFGFIAAVWSNALFQNLQRIRESRKRVLAGFLKGVIGTYASYHKIAGDKCLELERGVLQKLGLFESEISFSRHLERFTEFLNLLLLLSQSFEKIFKDILFLQTEEVGEVEEPFDENGPSGSSSLPQKRNPILSLYILSRCGKIRANASAMAGTTVKQSHDSTAFSMENLTIPESCILMGDVLLNAQYIFSNLRIYPDNMNENLKATNGLVMTESLMLGMAKKTGQKHMAQRIVKKAVSEAITARAPFSNYILTHRPIREILSEEEIRNLLDPYQHLGMIDHSIDLILKRSL